MAADRTRDVNALLERIRSGDDAAADELAPLVLDELHELARRMMARQRGDHTLQTTALLNEAWLRLSGAWADKGHFMRTAAAAMRSVLVDHARARKADKRGGGLQRAELSPSDSFSMDRDADLVLTLDEIVRRLTELDPELGRTAELRCFGGLSNDETARALGVSTPTIERRWRTARAWLQRELEAG